MDNVEALEKLIENMSDKDIARLKQAIAIVEQKRAQAEEKEPNYPMWSDGSSMY